MHAASLQNARHSNLNTGAMAGERLRAPHTHEIILVLRTRSTVADKEMSGSAGPEPKK